MVKRISSTNIENMLYDVERYCLKNVESMLDLSKALDPLYWYVRTGRASSEFLNALINAKPFVIGRVLLKAKGSSYDEVINRLCKKFAIKRYS